MTRIAKPVEDEQGSIEKGLSIVKKSSTSWAIAFVAVGCLNAGMMYQRVEATATSQAKINASQELHNSKVDIFIEQQELFNQKITDAVNNQKDAANDLRQHFERLEQILSARH